MMRNYVLLISFLWVSSDGFAQSDIAVGSWRTHNSYNSLVAMSGSAEAIFAASSTAIFSYNPLSRELVTITSLSGLNDTDITTVGYNLDVELLIIAYGNGNIDFLQNNKIINFPHLLNAEINGSKEVHQIYNYQQKSYLSTDFGLMIIDLNKMQVEDTYFELGPSGQTITVYNAVIAGDSLYLATELGVMRGSLQDNLKDFSQWKFFGPTEGLPANLTKVILPTPAGLLTAQDNAGIFEYDGNTWQDKNLLTLSTFKHGSQQGNITLLTSTDTVYQYSGGSVVPIVTNIGNQPEAALHNSGIIWIADGKNGLVNTTANKSIYPNGPYSNQINNLYTYQNKVIAMPPAYDNSFQPLRNKDGFFKFENGLWDNFNSSGYPNTMPIPSFYDISDAVYSATDESLYLSSFGYGILKMDSEGSEIIDDSNSPLVNTSPPGNNVLVSALAINNNELSLANFSALPSLHINIIGTSNWQSFSPSVPSAYCTQIINLGNGVQWLRLASSFGGGIMVYDAASGRELYLNRNSGTLPDSEVYDMALDNEGKMWVATKRGVVYFHQAAFILDFSIVDPVLPIFDGRILFKGEKITALAIDGGNRVWMGTTAGLWLFANDGQEEILHFTAGLDPLPSNDILDLAINHTNGEVFIATGNGLISYRGMATAGSESSEVKIFPNPVILTQNDIVTFEGVPENANLWITDSSGRLIFETQANGNTAVWQGLAGNQSISSGVYFVFVANDDGSAKQVGKLALIN